MAEFFHSSAQQMQEILSTVNILPVCLKKPKQCVPWAFFSLPLGLHAGWSWLQHPLISQRDLQFPSFPQPPLSIAHLRMNVVFANWNISTIRYFNQNYFCQMHYILFIINEYDRYHISTSQGFWNCLLFLSEWRNLYSF